MAVDTTVGSTKVYRFAADRSSVTFNYGSGRSKVYGISIAADGDDSSPAMGP